MDLSKENLGVISGIYEVILDNNQWTGVLDNLDRQIGSIGCNVFVADHSNHELTAMNVSTNLKPALSHYLAEGHHRADETMLAHYQELIPERRFVQIRDVYEQHNNRYGTDLDASVFEYWIEANLGIKYRYTSPLNHKKSYVDVVTYQFGDLPQNQIDRSLALAEVYTPHLAKAIELTRPFTLLYERFKAVLSVLDRFHLGVMILADNGSMVLSNRAARNLLDQDDGLRIRESKLTTDTNAKGQLHKAQALALELLKEERNNLAQRLSIPRRSGATPYIVDVSPLHSREIDLKVQFRGLLVVIVDPDHHHIVDVSGLELLFALTDAEKAVCRLLVSGCSTDEIAETRNVNPNTIRKQINSLLGKTDTRNRAELVQLALSINIPVDQPDGEL